MWPAFGEYKNYPENNCCGCGKQIANTIRCHNCWNGTCEIKEVKRPTQYCMTVKMDRGVFLGNFGTRCNLPGNQCYTNDETLSRYGLDNDGCAEPTNELKKEFRGFSELGGSINEICLCKEDLCNGDPGCKDSFEECHTTQWDCEQDFVKKNCQKHCNLCQPGYYCKDEASWCEQAKPNCSITLAQEKCAKYCGQC